MKISTVYNSIINEMSTMFATKGRIPNPYELENNPILSKDMWGVRVDSATIQPLEMCSFSIDRTFTVILLKKLPRMESKDSGFDVVTKEILEDSNAVLNLFLNAEEIQQSSNVEKIDLSNFSGIQSLSNNDDTYIYIEISFNILISESYT